MVVQNTIEIQLGFANAVILNKCLKQSNHRFHSTRYISEIQFNINTRVQPITPNTVAQNTMRSVGQKILNVQCICLHGQHSLLFTR